MRIKRALLTNTLTGYLARGHYRHLQRTQRGRGNVWVSHLLVQLQLQLQLQQMKNFLYCRDVWVSHLRVLQGQVQTPLLKGTTRLHWLLGILGESPAGFNYSGKMLQLTQLRPGKMWQSSRTLTPLLKAQRDSFDVHSCCNSGMPIQVEWDQVNRGFIDGFGLCSPTRWRPSQRGERRTPEMLDLANATFNILSECRGCLHFRRQEGIIQAGHRED